MLEWLKRLVRMGLTRRSVEEAGTTRRVRVTQEEPDDRFVLIIILMIVFFVGLLALEVIHIIVLGTWNDLIFNGIMLVVGTIVGAIWGNQQ